VLSEASDSGTVCPETTVEEFDTQCQPTDIAYPSTNTGKLTKGGQPKVRHFNKDWYSKYPWLHWSLSRGKLFCFNCVKAKKHNLFLSAKNQVERAFVDIGFVDWKNVVAAFDKHSQSACHKEAIDACASVSRRGVETLLFTHMERQQAVASEALSVIIGSVKYLARQGLRSLRGHTENSGNLYSSAVVTSKR
jgi:hypothetical protein